MKKERISQAIHHKKSDIVPYNIELTSELMENVIQHVGIEKQQFDEWVGNHCRKISYNIGGKYIKPGIFQDEFGVVWDRTGLDKDIGIITEYRIKGMDFNTYTFPQPDLDTLRKKTEQALSEDKDVFTFGKIGTTYFERAWSLTGMEILLMNLALNHDFVRDLFQRILDYNMKIIEIALQYPIDGFYFGDDYGQQRGLLISPDMWREFMKPGLEEMFRTIKNAGKVVALHSCGKIEDIFDDLIEIGLDIYQTVQPEVYDMQQIKNTYGDRLTFWGGISTQQTLPFKTPQEIRDITKETLAIMGKNGGYIAAPTHRVPADVPVDNMLALIETLQNQ